MSLDDNVLWHRGKGWDNTCQEDIVNNSKKDTIISNSFHWLVTTCWTKKHIGVEIHANCTHGFSFMTYEKYWRINYPHIKYRSSLTPQVSWLTNRPYLISVRAEVIRLNGWFNNPWLINQFAQTSTSIFFFFNLHNDEGASDEDHGDKMQWVKVL